MTATRAVSLAAALALAGCAVGPSYRRPAVDVPAAHRGDAGPETAASLADLGWWDVFRDDALRALVREALAGNYDVRIAAARVEQARATVGVVRADMLPQASYQGSATREQSPASLGGRSRTFNVFAGALDVAWEVDLWGRIRRATEAARADLLASEAAHRGVMLSLVADVAQAYFELCELDRELAIARRTTDAFTRTRDLFATQLAGGKATRLDVSRADAALAQTAATVPDLRRQIVLKENQIALLLGRNPGPIERGAALEEQRLPPEVPAGLPSALLERRPDVLEAEQAVVAANANVGVAVADFFPRIGLTAVYGAQSTELRDLTSGPASMWNIAASMTGPLFQSGKLWFGYRASRAALDAAALAYEAAARAAFADVSNTLVARQELVAVRAERARAVTALRAAVELSLDRYRAGLAAYFEVLDAEQQLFPAENALAQTERDQLVAVVQIYRALGGGWRQSDDAWRTTPG